MEKLGISQMLVNFFRVLYKNSTSIIINNGFLCPQVALSRSLRQRCPLSLPSQVIQREVTTSNINTNKSITGIHIPNKTKQIKISQYGDDSKLFLKHQESAANVLRFFEILNKATGTAIKLWKNNNSSN